MKNTRLENRALQSNLEGSGDVSPEGNVMWRLKMGSLEQDIRQQTPTFKRNR